MSTSNRRCAVALRFSLLFVLAAVVAAGCGGSDSGDAAGKSSKRDGKTTTVTSTPSTTETTTSTDEATKPVADAGDGRFCGDKSDQATVAKRANAYKASPGTKLDAGTKYVVEVTTTEGAFNITVDQKQGPTAAANFVGLVRDCFYDGIVFHRVIKGFMVQTGDPQGTGTGGPGYSIKDDNVTEDYQPGVVAMANAGPDTGGSQFFVVQGDTVQLGPAYSIFGHVDAAGLNVIDKIANTKVTTGGDGAPSSPVKPIRIITARLVQGA